MKKLLLLAIITLFTCPALAIVNFSVTDIGSGQLRISYTTTAGEQPRAITLVIDTGNPGVTVDSGTDHVSGHVAFNTFMDWAWGDPSTYQVGDGHGIANSAQAGEPMFPASRFSLSLAVLDQGGNQAAGPTSTSDLATIQLHSAVEPTTVTITITADTLRGPSSGVVGGNGKLDSNLDGAALIVPYIPDPWPEPDCGAGDAAFLEQWSAADAPFCWCKENNPRQCLGDADNAKQGRFNYAVSTDDLNILSDAWNKNMANTLGTGVEGDGVSGGNPWICADFDHKGQGRFLYRVSTDDLNILSANWNIPDGPADNICQNTTGDQTP